MTMARPLPVMAPPSLARVTVFHAMDEAERHWRALESAGALMTPYQRFDFLSLWQRHLGAAEGMRPAIVVGFDASDRPLVVMPFGVRAFAALRIVQFLGGKHANFNLALWRCDFAKVADRNTIARLFATLDTDAAILRNQPYEWGGVANPLALWPHAESPSLGHKGALKRDFDALINERLSSSTRRKIRKKAEKLNAAGPLSFARAGSCAQAQRVLEVFFAQKVARMRLIGQPDVFDDPAVRDFLAAAVTGSGTQRAPIEIYSLSVGDDVIATFAGVCDGARFSAMFNSIVPDRFQTESPGEQLLFHLVKHCCERGIMTFDLGVGEARYKSLFCEIDEPLFDSFIALSPAGRLYAAGAAAATRAKRLIKSSPALWQAADGTRRFAKRMLSR
jgi:CelD/BcsL family acetyltransferase involved in cellulose biosynthesis